MCKDTPSVGGEMVKRTDIPSVGCAPPSSYQVLSATAFESRLAEMEQKEHETFAFDPLVVSSSTNLPHFIGYPAFQLDARLDHSTFLKVRQLYKASGDSETYLWDFLRTVHVPLGATTGVDFLLGFYTPDIASLNAEEREEHFLDLANEEIWRLQQ